MRKCTAFSLVLLLSYNPVYIIGTPIKIKSEILKLVDGTTIFNATNVGTIKVYMRDVKQFMHEKYIVDGTAEYTLSDCVRLEDQNNLPACKELLFAQMVQKFASFSDHFIEMLRPSKKMLIELIKEFAINRDRLDSTLVKWAEHIDDDERALFKREISSFRKFGTFCIDLIHFMEDLLASCPKAAAEYAHLTKRTHEIRTQVDQLLQIHNITLNSQAHKSLIKAINTHYEPNEDESQEKTQRLFAAHINTLT